MRKGIHKPKQTLRKYHLDYAGVSKKQDSFSKTTLIAKMHSMEEVLIDTDTSLMRTLSSSPHVAVFEEYTTIFLTSQYAPGLHITAGVAVL